MARSLALLAVLASALVSTASAFGQGLVLPGAGAVNRSMAGASTASAIDAAGAGYWNPATIRSLPHNEVMFGAELIYADTNLSSSVGAAAGRNFSDSGLPALPTIAFVHHAETMPVTFSMGIYALLGGGVNFPQVPTNPVLSRAPIYASASALGIQPSAAVQVSDRWTVGAGPIISSMSLGLDPAFFAGGPLPFPTATPGRPFWGAGFQVGALYNASCDLDVGFSYKSPVWFETFKYNAQDAAGNPLELGLDLELPQIFSAGLEYRGIPGTKIAVDLRYLDYRNAKLWGDSIPTPGLGWDGVWAFAIGAERQLNDRFALRMGYLANENPVPDVATLFNTQVPGINQQQVSLGGSLQMTPAITMDTTVVYGFSSSIEGPLPIPGVGVGRVGLKQDLISLAVSMRFAY